jgi:hypothetical protein
MSEYKLPDPLKGLIIENDWHAPSCVLGLIKDNPELFKDVITIGQARHYPDEVAEALKGDINTIIVSSTFIYFEQLEDSVKLFQSINKPLYFIIEHANQKLNEWVSTRYGRVESEHNFDDYKTFITAVKSWVTEGRVFDLTKDYKKGYTIHDELHGWSGNYESKDREPYTTDAIHYSEKYNMFYRESDGEDYCIEGLKRTHRI